MVVPFKQLIFYSNLYEAIGNVKSCDILYLDFNKAFDKIPYQRLLKSLGINGNILGWIKTYLSYRSQRVVVNGFNSKWGRIFSRAQF